jgi:peptidoglycan L-alanyl-D-glutamate endopeptidase CwlK
MNDIKGLHPKVADGVSQMLTEAKARGLSVGLFCGLRTAEEQDKLFNKVPKVTNAKGWDSWHQYGLAVDIVFKDEKGNWTWNEKKDWEGLGKIGEMFGFVWGGRWKFKDYPHFQMTGLVPNVKEAKRILDEKGIDVLWSMI